MTSTVENEILQEELRPIIKALRTCRGQLDGILGMIENSRDALEISNQLLAAQAMLKRANKIVLTRYIDQLMRGAFAEPGRTEPCITEINVVLDKLLRQP